MHIAIKIALEQSNGIIGRRGHPELATQIDDALRRQELVALLPGVYGVPEVCRRVSSLVQAVALWDPGAVIVGEAAAALTFWPELRPRRIEVASKRQLPPRGPFTFTQRTVPGELVRHYGPVRIADPSLTAIDMASEDSADSIDRALRSRMVTLRQLYQALDLTEHRRGNNARRRLLLDSRGEPWSAAERLAHRTLRAAGITAWHSNVLIDCDGQRYFLDIAMDDCPLVIEIDGWAHHSSREVFESDRRRGNMLLLHGKQVLHFTWLMLSDEPDWVVGTVRRARAMADQS